MTLKNEFDKTVNDVKDGVSESAHRTVADAEKARRETEGNEMTSSEKLESLANEGRHRTQGEIDHAKRAVRDHT
ncbi:MAG TPA: hypothetical protein VIK27_10290 [Candidatus Aquilonibacter sp.]